MQFKPFEDGIEVNGQTVYAIVDGFAFVQKVPSKILVAEGIGELGPDRMIVLDKEGWYPQAAWLRAFKNIARTVGPSTLHAIGGKIPENAVFPPWVVDVPSAVRAIDVAYHLNHRKDGRVMFDMATKTMLEGIGHYGFEQVSSNKVVSVCENPYPCEFDHGIIEAMAQKFAPKAKVTHDHRAPCRRDYAESCTYTVTW